MTGADVQVLAIGLSSALAAILVTVIGADRAIAAIKQAGGQVTGDDPMGTPQWDFTKNWATTLTAAGAILATALSLKVPTGFSIPAQVLGLSLFAALVVIVAPLLYSAGSRAEKVDDSGKKVWELQGTVSLFFTSAGVTLWGVYMELGTGMSYAVQLWKNPGGPLSALLFWAFEALMFLTAVLVGLYAYNSIYEALASQATPPEAVEQPRRRRWTPL